MNKLAFLTEVETEKLCGGGRGKNSGVILGSFNDTRSNTVGLNQIATQTATATKGGISSNLSVQLAALFNAVG